MRVCGDLAHLCPSGLDKRPEALQTLMLLSDKAQITFSTMSRETVVGTGERERSGPHDSPDLTV